MQYDTRDQSSLRELNQRFLELAAADPLDGPRLAGLSRQQRAAAAACPYALFDLRLHDAAHWQMRMAAPFVAGVADGRESTTDRADFVCLALFYAWHVAVSGSLGAKLLLGMHELTARALTEVTVDRLPGLARAASRELRARWVHCERFWAALARAAETDDEKRLRRVQLYGIQLAAAAQLPLRAEAREV